MDYYQNFDFSQEEFDRCYKILLGEEQINMKENDKGNYDCIMTFILSIIIWYIFGIFFLIYKSIIRSISIGICKIITK